MPPSLSVLLLVRLLLLDPVVLLPDPAVLGLVVEVVQLRSLPPSAAVKHHARRRRTTGRLAPTQTRRTRRKNGGRSRS